MCIQIKVLRKERGKKKKQQTEATKAFHITGRLKNVLNIKIMKSCIHVLLNAM